MKSYQNQPSPVIDTSIAVGKYRVFPWAKLQSEGCYAASVSISSGRGAGTHDRVIRFSDLFDSAAAALNFATEHALNWIQERQSPGRLQLTA